MAVGQRRYNGETGWRYGLWLMFRINRIASLMFELPLFPLNSVLFPGMTNSLYIFEERYQLMINTCLQKQQPFGWVLIEEGQEALGPLARPFRVGCTAQIVRVQPLEQGTMNILIIGQERFEIAALNDDLPYLVGSVQLSPVAHSSPDRLRRLDGYLRPLVERYLMVLANSENIDFDPLQLPVDPVALAWLAAAIVQQLSNPEKQALLSVPSAARLLREIYAIYHREVALLDMMIDRGNDPVSEPFSLN